MNFDFSDDQKILREQARRFLEAKSPPKAVRAILESDQAYDRDLWRAVAEMGWLGTAIPEEFGGLGLGYLELCVLAEELGRSLAPVPFASSVYLAAEALLLAGSEEQKDHYLPRIASGEAIGTLALSEGPKPATPRTLEATCRGGRLSGVKLPVPDGMAADFAIVAARTVDEPGPHAISLFVVDLTGPGVDRENVQTIDPTRKQARIAFTDAPAAALGDAGEGWSLVERILDRAAILFAFEQVGGAQACLDMAKDYALGRYAFGRPIASFQAIKHKLADVYVKLELARSNAYYGAWALSTDAAELPVAAAGARVAAIDAYEFAARENVQTHGGMGYTWEFDCHLYYRRSRLLALNIGTKRAWSDRLIDHLERRNVA
jgi:acyl-CoA dehydrogenase